MTQSNEREQKEIEYWLAREKAARAALDIAIHPAAKYSHHVLAERYADRAWSLAEATSDPSFGSSL